MYKIPRTFYDADQSIAEQEIYAEGMSDASTAEPNAPIFELEWMGDAYRAGRDDYAAIA